uniref:Uncharacterized protein n=1 Tax=mine drainage metagenome TaxID=410659 RepID=E6QVA5_9ZZZZ
MNSSFIMPTIQGTFSITDDLTVVLTSYMYAIVLIVSNRNTTIRYHDNL